MEIRIANNEDINVLMDIRKNLEDRKLAEKW